MINVLIAKGNTNVTNLASATEEDKHEKPHKEIRVLRLNLAHRGLCISVIASSCCS